MNLHPRSVHGSRGSVLIIVLWVAFGLISIALYFGNATSMELRASDNRVASMAAQQAIEGASRYLSYILSNLDTNGFLPDSRTYLTQSMKLGDATVWMVGRDPQQANPKAPTFGLIDEASKLNLNTATLEMLQALPRMTPEFAAAIIDWRDTNTDVTTGGAEDDTYMRLTPPYHCKNADFESVDELRLVYGADLDLLFGEDINRNGVLDQNEDDGNASLPVDNRDGRLDAGILEYVTVYSREVNTNSDGVTRVSIPGPPGPGGGLGTRLDSVLQSKLPSRANQLRGRLDGLNPPVTSVLDLYLRGIFTDDEFYLIEPYLINGAGTFVVGQVNVNTASEPVLECIPGIGPDKAPSLVAYRLSNPSKLTSVAWVASVLDRTNAVTAGRYLTSRSYQFTADLMAVGQYGRGFRRERFVFETLGSTARILQRQDLSHHGWAIGPDVWRDLQRVTGIMQTGISR